MEKCGKKAAQEAEPAKSKPEAAAEGERKHKEEPKWMDIDIPEDDEQLDDTLAKMQAQFVGASSATKRATLEGIAASAKKGFKPF